MSHFSVYVIYPGDPDPSTVEEAVTELLAPYDENMDVEPYEQSCHCNNALARVAGQVAADAVEPRESIRARYRIAHETWLASHEGRMDETERALVLGGTLFGEAEDIEAIEQKYPGAPSWAEYMYPWTTIATRVESAHPLFGRPDPECEDCHGTGTHLTTVNPNGHWDWWTIGGRWDGALGGANVQSMTTLGDVATPYALITPDGEWHQRGHMGWFGQSSGEMPREVWQSMVQDLLRKYRTDAYAIAIIDCHV